MGAFWEGMGTGGKALLDAGKRPKDRRRPCPLAIEELYGIDSRGKGGPDTPPMKKAGKGLPFPAVSHHMPC